MRVAGDVLPAAVLAREAAARATARPDQPRECPRQIRLRVRGVNRAMLAHLQPQPRRVVLEVDVSKSSTALAAFMESSPEDVAPAGVAECLPQPIRLLDEQLLVRIEQVRDEAGALAHCGAPELHDLHQFGHMAAVALSSSDPAQRRLMAALEAAGVRLQIGIETPYSVTQCALVLAGAGVAVNNPLVAREYAALGLHNVPLDAAMSFRALLAFQPRQAQSRAVQKLVALCRTLLEPAPPTRSRPSAGVRR